MKKFLEKYSKKLTYLILVFQLSIIFWIIYQFFVLINDYNLAFFSWTQVVNDTAVLLIPISIILIIFLLWIKISKEIEFFILQKKIKYNFINNQINFILNLSLFWIIYWIEKILPFVFKYLQIKSLSNYLSIYWLILYPIFLWLIWYNLWIYFLKKWYWFGKFLSLFFVWSSLFIWYQEIIRINMFITETRFNRLYVIKKDIENWQKLKNNNIFWQSINLSWNKVIYLNDKYVFTENLVLNNDNSLIFFKR